MSEIKKQTQAEKYLIAHEYEANEHGAFIYTSTSGNHKVEMEAVLEDYHHESSKDNMEAIEELEEDVSKLSVKVADLIKKKYNLQEKVETLQYENDELSTRTEGFTHETLIDEKKLEILKRLYKHLSLDELEDVEAPFKDRTGYIDVNY